MSKNYTSFQNDQQWIRRCKQEELALINQFSDMDEAEERARLMQQYQNRKGKNQTNIGPREEVKQPSQPKASQVAYDQRSVKSHMSKPQASRQDDAISYKSDLKSQQQSQAAQSNNLLDKISQRSYVSSSIRTTTTTRDRLAQIEKQLEEETQKRKAAELAIAKLTRGPGMKKQ